MALDKLVDSAQLDADLTSVANAIRAKTGESGQLVFPTGFVSAIGSISGGYGVTASFDPGENYILSTDDLDDLKSYLTVTVTYPDSTTVVLDDNKYSLSGILTAGTSTITVSVLDVTTTFTVDVIAANDVTPALSNLSPGSSVQYECDADAGYLKIWSTSNGTYRGVATPAVIDVQEGLMYRVTADVNVHVNSGQYRIALSRPSDGRTILCSNGITENGKLRVEGTPSDSSYYVSPLRLQCYVTWSTSTAGSATFSNMKVVEFSPAVSANEIAAAIEEAMA